MRVTTEYRILATSCIAVQSTGIACGLNRPLCGSKREINLKASKTALALGFRARGMLAILALMCDPFRSLQVSCLECHRSRRQGLSAESRKPKAESRMSHQGQYSLQRKPHNGLVPRPRRSDRATVDVRERHAEP
jgi:hypothetical protein